MIAYPGVGTERGTYLRYLRTGRNTSTFWIDAVNGAIVLLALLLARLIESVRA